MIIYHPSFLTSYYYSIALREDITSGQHWFRSAIRGPLFRESAIPALAMSKPNCLNHNVTVEFVDIYIGASDSRNGRLTGMSDPGISERASDSRNSERTTPGIVG
jgi:hypothetical protein